MKNLKPFKWENRSFHSQSIWISEGEKKFSRRPEKARFKAKRNQKTTSIEFSMIIF